MADAGSSYLNQPCRTLDEVLAARWERWEHELAEREAAAAGDDALTAFIEATESILRACIKGMAACQTAIAVINADRAARGLPPLEV